MRTRPTVDQMVNINGERLKIALDTTGFTLIEISELMLGKQKAYLSGAMKKGRIGLPDLEKVCKLFKLNKEDYIIPDVPKEAPKKKEEPTKETTAVAVVDLTETNKKLDTLIAAVEFLAKGIDSLYNLQVQQQKRLFGIETAVTQTAKNTAATVEELKVDLDSIDDGVGKVNSNLNIVKGKMDDMAKKSKMLASIDDNVVKLLDKEIKTKPSK